MPYLMDTHVFLWWIVDDPRLPQDIRQIITSHNNTLFFSAASAWEIAIKAQLGKLQLQSAPPTFLADQLVQNAFDSLAVHVNHAMQVFHLPLHHRDPFDRLLIAQSQIEDFPILSTDRAFRLYDVKVVG